MHDSMDPISIHLGRGLWIFDLERNAGEGCVVLSVVNLSNSDADSFVNISVRKLRYLLPEKQEKRSTKPDSCTQHHSLFRCTPSFCRVVKSKCYANSVLKWLFYLNNLSRKMNNDVSITLSFFL